MNTNKLIGHKITHVSWGEGIIITADSKYITVSYSGQGEKKYQFPKAFESFLTIDEKSLQDEIREEIENLLILRSLKTAYDPFIYWLNRVKIVQMAFGSVNRLLQTSGSLLMNEQTSSLI